MSENLSSTETRPLAGEASQLGPTFLLLRWAGYGLLGLSIMDLLESAVPWDWMNPAWEMQFMGALVDRSPVPLLGLVLVFVGGTHLRRRWEAPALAGLSWMALVLGVLLFLMTPLIITNTFRLEQRATAQITSQMGQQLDQAEKARAAVQGANPQELENLVRRMGRPADGKTSQQLRSEMLAEFTKAKEMLQRQAGEARDNQRTTLIKRSAKMGAEAVLVGIVLVVVWRSTAWARRGRPAARA
jgi:hypothetical protein